MTTCSTSACGVGGWGGPLPGDPDNNSILSATPAFGGIDVSWSYPATNSAAVAHVLLYRGISSNFNSAVLLATVGGNFFYDKSTSSQLIQYYYWISIVSVNGTVGALIGPASATAKSPIASVIEGLTDKIDAGLLAQSLKTEIDRITLNSAAILNEVNNRISSNTALSAALLQVQTGVTQSITLLNTEITQRQEGDSALLSQLNTVAAANSSNLALIQIEQTARVTGDSANAALYTTLNSQVNNPTTGLPATRAVLLNDYYTKADTNSAISSATTSLVSTTALNTALGAYTNTAALQSTYYTKTQTDSAISSATTTLVSNSGLTNALGAYTTTAALQNSYYTKAATDSAISSAVTTSQTTLNGNIASAQTTLQTNINTVNGKVTEIGALYTAKVTVNGLIGGFGIYNDGTTVQAGFDVDEFWVGRTQANKRKPFIISGGVTYIDDAAIEKLTFTKLRAADSSLVFENGKLKADYINVTQITGGSFVGYAWPPAGQQGFFIGPGGFLMGNANNGKYIQITEDGNFFAPGFSIINGNASFSGTLTANIVNTSNIVGSAVTSGHAVETGGTSVAVSINNSTGATCMLVIVQAGDPQTVNTGSGESSGTASIPPTATININGTNVATGYTSISYIATTVPGGTFSVTALRPAGTPGIMKLFVLVTKR